MCFVGLPGSFWLRSALCSGLWGFYMDRGNLSLCGQWGCVLRGAACLVGGNNEEWALDAWFHGGVAEVCL